MFSQKIRTKNNPRFQLFFPGKSSLLFLPLIFHHKKYPSDQGGTLCFKDVSSIAKVDIHFDSNIPAKFLIPTRQIAQPIQFLYQEMAKLQQQFEKSLKRNKKKVFLVSNPAYDHYEIRIATTRKDPVFYRLYWKKGSQNPSDSRFEVEFKSTAFSFD